MKANGTNTGKAVLYMFYLGSFGGPRWIKVHANPNNEAALNVNNGLSTPTPVDTDGDGNIDLVYAGDIKGNLWRFNVRDPNAIVVTKIFQTANGQPIQVAPVVQNYAGGKDCTNPRDCWMVVFGTGAAINPLSETTDFAGANQAIYGVLDNGATGAAGLVTAADMVKQTLSSSQTTAGVTYRKVSRDAVDFKAGKKGWLIDLPRQVQSGTTTLPEHVSANLVRQNNGSVLIASTFATSSLPTCKASYLTQVNMATGQGSVDTLIMNGETITDVNSRLNPGQPTLGISIIKGTTLNTNKDEVVGSTFGALRQNLKLMIGRVSWREIFGSPK
jgi:type IV pilus assembly protein PilY1